MNLIIQRRAEIALRSLGRAQQKPIIRALDELSSTAPDELHRNPKLYRLAAASGEKLYVYKGSLRLRLILSIDADTCTVEDVVHYDKLNRFQFKGGQQ